MNPFKLVLASGSRYRAAQLSQLGLVFEAIRPDIDESPLPAETPVAAARRLSEAKARAVAAHRPNHWILGSDQTADHDGELLGKPGTAERAQAQLEQMSGNTVIFHSGLCLLSPSGVADTMVVPTAVRFRPLSQAEIATYIRREQPLDCAGSFKVEGLGISLFDAVRSDDPSALIGLPLIALCQMLRAVGVNPITAGLTPELLVNNPM